MVALSWQVARQPRTWIAAAGRRRLARDRLAVARDAHAAVGAGAAGCGRAGSRSIEPSSRARAAGSRSSESFGDTRSRAKPRTRALLVQLAASAHATHTLRSASVARARAGRRGAARERRGDDDRARHHTSPEIAFASAASRVAGQHAVDLARPARVRDQQLAADHFEPLVRAPRVVMPSGPELDNAVVDDEQRAEQMGRAAGPSNTASTSCRMPPR